MAKSIVRKKTPAKSAAKPKRAIRFAPDPGTIAELQFKLDDGRTVSHYGLVVNESRTGCAVVMTGDFKPMEETVCTAKVGELPRTIAAIRWVKTLDAQVFKFGLEYDL